MLFPPNASDLLARIPLSARTILEIGCGSGALAAACRAMNPNARLLGIEADPAAASQAAAHMNEVATAVDPLPFALPDGIDCIIYNEVLEQLPDPFGLLRRHARVLSHDGVMLICAASIEYWRMAETLLRGSTADPARADRRQARRKGFDLEEMRAALSAAGLTLCDVLLREPDPEEAAGFADALAPCLAVLGVDPREYAARAAPSHLILLVRRDRAERMVLAGNMLDPVGGVSHVRVVYPMQAMATDPLVTAGVAGRVESRPPGDDAPRIFVLHRPALVDGHGPGLLRRLAEAGYLVVTEFDDHPGHFDMMRQGGALGFYGVHAVQTSTTAMAEALREYHSEIAVFPNAVGCLPEVRNFTDPASMTVFFGALNRERSWLSFMPAINAVAAMAGARLKFQVVHDEAFFAALETPHKAFTPTCDYATYLQLLGRSEISLMPLADTQFNRAKSDLKFIEAGACRVAALASGVVYGDSIADGRTGLLFRDPVEFHARLLRLLAMPELARDLGDAARRYVADDRMLAYQVAPRIAWYRSLWARRDALEAARQERMRRRSAA